MSQMYPFLKMNLILVAFLIGASGYAQVPIIFPTPPYESNIDSTSLTLRWNTAFNGTSRVRYGLTVSYEIGETGDTILTKNHSVTLTGLQPATIYNVQLVSSNSFGISTLGSYIVGTASPFGSTGQMNVYFNKSVDTSIAAGEIAQGGVDLRRKLIDRIGSAKYSIDVALYSLTLSDVATALIDAKNRGVKVRVIDDIEDHPSESYEFQSLRSSGIPVLRAGTSGRMHNKFFICDYRDKSSAGDDWVWTGSHNPTDPGTFDDVQNVIEIQDQALAGAYTAEFNEMWGGGGDMPNPADARFGSSKSNNTPHIFNVGGNQVLLYFSPTDGTANQIVNMLSRCKKSICFAALVFTRSDIAREMKTVHDQRGVTVRGVIEKMNINTSGSQWLFLTQQPKWADVFTDNDTRSLLHHKYFICDGDTATGEPWVETGSYNFSGSAESENDENAIFIQSARIANLYLQEFTQRYNDYSETVFVYEDPRQTPGGFALFQNYPNPFNSKTRIGFRLQDVSFVDLKVYDMLGRSVSIVTQEYLSPGEHQIEVDASGLSSGVYFYRLTVKNSVMSEDNSVQTLTKSMILVK